MRSRDCDQDFRRTAIQLRSGGALLLVAASLLWVWFAALLCSDSPYRCPSSARFTRRR
ncbi:hypothetical protein [Streptomyces inusitatus]|uniref:hypothetical protein n=1 Tax=Streptomyces inusitatus TaxID=68221 RepID=UPI00167E2AB2|nr:hypothetical protein [Streptomyces inusitatus]